MANNMQVQLTFNEQLHDYESNFAEQPDKLHLLEELRQEVADDVLQNLSALTLKDLQQKLDNIVEVI